MMHGINVIVRLFSDIKLTLMSPKSLAIIEQIRCIRTNDLVVISFFGQQLKRKLYHGGLKGVDGKLTKEKGVKASKANVRALFFFCLTWYFDSQKIM